MSKFRKQFLLKDYALMIREIIKRRNNLKDI